MHVFVIFFAYLLLQIARFVVFAPFWDQKIFNSKIFSQIFCGSIEIGLSVNNDTCKGKTTYIWISPYPVQVGFTRSLLLSLAELLTSGTH